MTISKTKKIDHLEAKTWEIPCFPCEFLDLCGVGQDKNPIECVRLNRWILHRGEIEEAEETEKTEEIEEKTE